MARESGHESITKIIVKNETESHQYKNTPRTTGKPKATCGISSPKNKKVWSGVLLPMLNVFMLTP
jgi:hypothetical protein